MRERGRDPMDDVDVERQRVVADAGNPQVTDGQVRMADERRLGRTDDRVQVPGEGHEPGPAVRRGLGQLADHVRARDELAQQGVRHHRGQQPGQAGALVRCAQRHQGVHTGVAVEFLHVVAGDQAAEGVPDDVYARVARLLAHRLDHRGQLAGRRRDVRGEQRQVHGGDPSEASPAQRPAQPSEDRPVVDQAMDQQDRCARGFDVADEQPAPQRGEAVEGVAVGRFA